MPADQDSQIAVAGASNLLNHRHCFGFKEDVKDNVHYSNEGQIIYPAGNTVVLYHPDNQSQTFFQGCDESCGISCMAISANKSYLAVGFLGNPNSTGPTANASVAVII